jgi:hypothetical protein
VIVPIATRQHYADHLAPIIAALGELDCPDVALVASHHDLARARSRGFRRFILAQHGAGQSYGGDRRSARIDSYPGGDDNGDVGLFLVPNEHAASRWRAAYPGATVRVVGSPRLDRLPARVGPPGAVVAVSFHWNGHACPEFRSAWDAYAPVIPALAERFEVLGHGHPLRRDLPRFYRHWGIEHVPGFDDVCRRADVYVCDNSSTLFEFAATGRPVVVLNRKDYRRNVSHGLRFWDAADVGVQVNEPEALADAVAEALLDSPIRAAAREAALSIVYSQRTGATATAADAIREWIGA